MQCTCLFSGFRTALPAFYNPNHHCAPITPTVSSLTGTFSTFSAAAEDTPDEATPPEEEPGETTSPDEEEPDETTSPGDDKT